LHGERTMDTPASFVLNQDSFKGMGVDIGDINGDGLLDIYVSNLTSEWALTESHFLWLNTGQTQRMKDGIAPFRQASEELGLSRSGWSWDCRLADLNNDGVLEALQANGFIKGQINKWPELQSLGTSNNQLLHNPKFWPNLQPGDDVSGHDTFAFFVRGRDGRYYDVAPKLILPDGQSMSEAMVTRGISLADVDGDGRLDFAVANQWQPSYFYHNDCPKPGNFMGLHLLLPLQKGKATLVEPGIGHPVHEIPGRPAIGAAAAIRLPDGRQRAAQVDGGTGRITLVLTWLVAFIVQGVLRSWYFGTSWIVPLTPMTSAAFMVFTLYMIPDPATTPIKPLRQALFAIAIAAAYGMLLVEHVVYCLFIALAIVCAMRGVGLYAWAAWQPIRANQRGTLMVQVLDRRAGPLTR
jgi:hypothetical protein